MKLKRFHDRDAFSLYNPKSVRPTETGRTVSTRTNFNTDADYRSALFFCFDFEMQMNYYTINWQLHFLAKQYGEYSLCC